MSFGFCGYFEGDVYCKYIPLQNSRDYKLYSEREGRLEIEGKLHISLRSRYFKGGSRDVRKGPYGGYRRELGLGLGFLSMAHFV